MTKKQRIEALEKEVAEFRQFVERLQAALALLSLPQAATPPIPLTPPIVPYGPPMVPTPREFQPFSPYIPTRTSDNTNGVIFE